MKQKLQQYESVFSKKVAEKVAKINENMKSIQGKSGKKVIKERSDDDSCGFSIGFFDENIQEEWFIDDLGREPTREDWEAISEAEMQIERNALNWLKKKFEGARDEGHASDDTLIGNLWFDRSNRWQMNYIEDHYYDDPKDSGLAYEKDFYKGVNEYLPTGEKIPVLEVLITFFDVPEDIVDSW